MRKFRQTVPVVVLAAAAAGVIGTASPAAADVAVSVSPGMSNGFGTGCTYEVRAVVGNDSYSTRFLDNGELIPGSDRSDAYFPDRATAAQKWTPKTTGAHVITAEVRGTGEVVSITVDVRSGINLGSACVVI